MDAESSVSPRLMKRRLADMPPEASEKGSQRAKTQKGRRRKAVGKKQKQAGQLKSMIGMPLDVLSEIASHLHPLDLLQLSRVSVDFRAIFTSHSALYMWIAARRNVPCLPDCPDDLSEMEYARLLFENDCEACGRIPRSDAASRYRSFTLRLRLCKQCYDFNVKKGSTCMRTLKLKNMPDEIYSLLPCDGYLNVTDASSNTEFRKYYKPEFELVAREYLGFEDLAERAAFVLRRQELANMLMATGAELRDYKRTEQTLKFDDMKQLIADRETDIKAKLVELGYEENDFVVARRHHRWQWSNMVEQPKALTPHGWGLVRHKLTRLLDTSKLQELEELREREKSNRFRELRSVYPDALAQNLGQIDRAYLCDVRDFASLPSVYALMEEEDYSIPVTLDRLAAISEDIAGDFQTHRNRTRRLFAREFIAHEQDAAKTETTADVDRSLSAATALFGCLCAPKAFTLEQFLRHGHVSERLTSWDSFISSQRDLNPRNDYSRHRGSWCMFETLRARSQLTLDAARDILRALGLAEDIPLADAQAMGRQFTCSCGQGTAHVPKQPMTFVELVEHVVEQRDVYHSLLPRSIDFKYTLLPVREAGDYAWEEYEGLEPHADHDGEALSALLSLVLPSDGHTHDLDGTATACTDAFPKRMRCTRCYLLGKHKVTPHCSAEAAAHLKSMHDLDEVLNHYMVVDEPDPSWGAGYEF